MAHSTFSAWTDAQQSRFQALAGHTVLRYRATEMALVESGPSGAPVFGRHSQPFLQLNYLQLWLAGHPPVVVGTYQNDDTWGLSLEERLVLEGDAATRTSVFREANLSQLPLGVITAVGARRDSAGDLATITLGFATEEIVLAAGEVYENAHGPPTVAFGDESILVFHSSESFHAVRKSLVAVIPSE